MNNTSKQIPTRTQMNESARLTRTAQKQRPIIIFGLQHEHFAPFFRTLFELYSAAWLANVIKNYSVSRTHRLSSNKPIERKKNAYLKYLIYPQSMALIYYTTINLNLTHMPDWMKSMRVLARARFQFNGASKQKHIEWMDTSVCHMVASQLVSNHQMKITLSLFIVWGRFTSM